MEGRALLLTVVMSPQDEVTREGAPRLPIG